MIPTTILIALLLALTIVVLVYFLLKNKGPWGSLWSFTLIEFLAIWAGGIWASAIHPSDINWVPLVFTGVVIALILVVMTPWFQPEQPEIPENIDFLERQHLAGLYEAEVQKKRQMRLTLFFVFVIVFIAAIVLGYR